jgi:hypothetical protein
MTYTFTEPFNYQRDRVPVSKVALRGDSPTLVRLSEFLLTCYGGQSLGIGSNRPVRGGISPSTHNYGAALDWRYANVGVGRIEVGRKLALDIIDWIDAHALDIGIQQMHDYQGGRIWKIGRGWQAQKPNSTGMGQSWAQWFHFEVHPDAWRNESRIITRVDTNAWLTLPEPRIDILPNPPITTPPEGVPVPVAPPTVSVTIPSLSVLTKGATGTEVTKLQALLRYVWNQQEVTPDGNFGSVTEQAVRNVQAWCKLTVDGVVGRQTWTSILDA